MGLLLTMAAVTLIGVIIYAGEKKLEFRRVWAKTPVEGLIIYSTSPIQKIVAIAKIKQVHYGSIKTLHKLCREKSGGLTKKELYDSGLLGYGTKHPLLDDFIGDFLAISTSDKMFNFKGHSLFKGHHAGLTKDEMQVPLIIFQKQKDN